MLKRLLPVLLVALPLAAFAGDSEHPPLPQKLIAAKTAFIQNDSGEQGFSDAVFTQLNEWGRWRVVANRTQADVVIALDHKDGLHNYFYLRVTDRESGDALWTARKDAAIRIWGRVARNLMSNLRQQLPPLTASAPQTAPSSAPAPVPGLVIGQR